MWNYSFPIFIPIRTVKFVKFHNIMSEHITAVLIKHTVSPFFSAIKE